MPAWQISKGVIGAKKLRLGGTYVNIATALTGSQSVTAGSINANLQGTITITATGVLATDLVTIEGPAALDAGLVFQSYAVTADTITIKVRNVTGSTINDAARVWVWKAVRVVVP